ncbi:MAG: hypothetical protein JST04_11430 [Bdellovibrionales bacterium]|nr:hypothetical protein [Bdellovibrionales bacterium]
MNKLLVLFALSAAPLAASASTVVVNCNHGALRILREAPNEYRIIVSDSRAVDYVLDQAARTIQVRDTGGNLITTRAGLPMVAKVVKGPHPAFVIDQVRYQPVSHGYATGGGAVYFKPYARGADLTFTNGEMTTSRYYAFWQVANWWFDSCEYR